MTRVWYLGWPGWEMGAEESGLCDSPPVSAAYCSIRGILPGTTHTPQLCSAHTFLGKKPKLEWLYSTMLLKKSLAHLRDTAEVKFKLTPTVACRITKPRAWLPDSVDSKDCLFAGLWWVRGQSGFVGSGLWVINRTSLSLCWFQCSDPGKDILVVLWHMKQCQLRSLFPFLSSATMAAAAKSALDL